VSFHSRKMVTPASMLERHWIRVSAVRRAHETREGPLLARIETLIHRPSPRHAARFCPSVIAEPRAPKRCAPSRVMREGLEGGLGVRTYPSP
jgi:hypothetical protein